MTDEKQTAGDIFDASWEIEARAALEAAGQDPDLGVNAARDALRVVSGELAEDEFQRRYHEAFIKEFGSDDRPIGAPNGRSLVGAAAEVGGNGSAGANGDASDRSGEQRPDEDGGISSLLSRRNVLRLAASGTAALFLGTVLRSQARGASTADAIEVLDPSHTSEGENPTGVRYGMVIDLEACTGCMSCVNGCYEENTLADGEHWLYVLSFVDENKADEEDPNFLVRPCQHCSNAPCVKVCPVGARHVREEDGLVLSDYEICIGCRYCEVACPFAANQFQWAEPSSYGGGYEGERRDMRGREVIGSPPRGIMGKCNFCPQRQDEPDTHGASACSLSCTQNAIHIGDLNDPESAPMRYLARRQEENPDVSTFRLLDHLGTQPNIIYIGHEPTERARQVPGPIRYEDWGLVDRRSDVLEEGRDPWFQRIVGEG